MSTIIINAHRVSTLLICLASLPGCHQDIASHSTSSATDDESIFGTSTGASSDTDVVPTTSAGGTTDGGIDPTQFCKLHPNEEFDGLVHVCSGEVSGGIKFDYYGDLPIDDYVVCIDMREPPFEEEMPAGYMYTCLVNVADYQFAPDVPQPNGHQVDACCLRDTPFEAAADYCRVDAAEEFCLGAVDGLNVLRAQLPAFPVLAELNHQLENLNKYVANSGTQTECSKTLGTGFVAEGDFVSPDGVSWPVDHPQALDPQVGWPWFRNINAHVSKLEIEMAEHNGLSCTQLEGDAVSGELAEGTLAMDSHLGNTETLVVGNASFRQSACRLDSCEFKLETFQLRIEDFEIGTYSFSDVSVALASPAIGLINDDAIGLPEHGMHLTATFRVAEEGSPMFDGAPVSVGLRNNGVAELRLQPDSSIAIKSLNVTRWPLEMSLVSEVSL